MRFYGKVIAVHRWRRGGSDTSEAAKKRQKQCDTGMSGSTIDGGNIISHVRAVP